MSCAADLRCSKLDSVRFINSIVGVILKLYIIIIKATIVQLEKKKKIKLNSYNRLNLFVLDFDVAQLFHHLDSVDNSIVNNTDVIS